MTKTPSLPPLPPSVTAGFANSSSYDLHRPSYPSAAVSTFLSHLYIADVPHAHIVEVAAGTGKFTELLLQRPEAFEIVAVEPHAGMREELLGKELGIAKGSEREESGRGSLTVLDGVAARMEGVADGWGDAVIVAQGFHWFANEEAVREIHRVLRPGGALGLIWNIEDYNAPMSWKCSTRWEHKIKDITLAFDDGQPRFRHQKWKDAFSTKLDGSDVDTTTFNSTPRAPKFSKPLGEEIVKWTVWLSDDAVWERYLTLSQVAMLQGAEKENVRREVFKAMKGEDVERNEKGEVALHGATYFAWTSRT